MALWNTRLLQNISLKQDRVMLCFFETDQNQTENEGEKLSSFQIANGEQG